MICVQQIFHTPLGNVMGYPQTLTSFLSQFESLQDLRWCSPILIFAWKCNQLKTGQYTCTNIPWIWVNVEETNLHFWCSSLIFAFFLAGEPAVWRMRCSLVLVVFISALKVYRVPSRTKIQWFTMVKWTIRAYPAVMTNLTMFPPKAWGGINHWARNPIVLFGFPHAFHNMFSKEIFWWCCVFMTKASDVFIQNRL